MYTLIIDILAKFGTWCCKKAIDMADEGHFDFKVFKNAQPTLLIYDNYYPIIKINLCFYTVVALLNIGIVWMILNLFF